MSRETLRTGFRCSNCGGVVDQYDDDPEWGMCDECGATNDLGESGLHAALEKKTHEAEGLDRALRALARHAKRLRNSADLFDAWRTGTERGVSALHARIAALNAERDAARADNEMQRKLVAGARDGARKNYEAFSRERIAGDAARAALLELALAYNADPFGPGGVRAHMLVWERRDAALDAAFAIVDPSGEMRGKGSGT